MTNYIKQKYYTKLTNINQPKTRQDQTTTSEQNIQQKAYYKTKR